jgi:SAM-dependent methyltransferase
MNNEDFPEMNFTGERYVPSIGGNIELEHRHRYLLARELCRGKDVLDLASGEGYGSAMLSSVANSVVGVDIARDAVKHAQKNYVHGNLSFMVGSCTEVPIPDSSIDVVVSFETLEHHAQHDEMMAEIKRVLRLEGMLIISTPDKYRYSIETNYKNEFHIKELYHHEFAGLLRRHFANASFYGQRVAFGSFVVGNGPNVKLANLSRGRQDLTCTEEMTDPIYWIGLASDAALPLFGSSFLEQSIDKSEAVLAYAGILDQFELKLSALQRSLSERTSELSALQQLLSERTSELSALQQLLSGRTSELSALQQLLSGRTSEVDTLLRTVAAREDEVVILKQTHSWRLTRPLRFVGRVLREKWPRVIAGLQSTLQIVRSMYTRPWFFSIRKQLHDGST